MPVSYRVEVDPTAWEEIREAADCIAINSPLNAATWAGALQKAIKSLEHFPNRCAIARESVFFGVELRQYIFKSHRIIFSVDKVEKLVRVLYVRHSKRRTIGDQAVEDEAEE